MDIQRAEAAMRALTYTMSDDNRKAMNAEAQSVSTWEAKCRVCGLAMYGTLKEIREHTCDDSKKS